MEIPSNVLLKRVGELFIPDPVNPFRGILRWAPVYILLYGLKWPTTPIMPHLVLVYKLLTNPSFKDLNSGVCIDNSRPTHMMNSIDAAALIHNIFWNSTLSRLWLWIRVNGYCFRQELCGVVCGQGLVGCF